MHRLYRLRYLVPALVATSVMAASLGWCRTDSLGSFLLNLSTELVGIVLTVVVVDRLLEVREKQRWKPYREMLLFHTSHKLNAVIDALSELVGEPETNLSLLIKDGHVSLRLDEALAQLDVLDQKWDRLRSDNRQSRYVQLIALRHALDQLHEHLSAVRDAPIAEPEDAPVQWRLSWRAEAIASNLGLLTEPSSVLDQLPSADIRPTLWNQLPEHLEALGKDLKTVYLTFKDSD
jgi:hypothetical protein